MRSQPSFFAYLSCATFFAALFGAPEKSHANINASEASCAIATSGQAMCQGYFDGDSFTSEPTDIDVGTQYAQIASGNPECGITIAGQIRCWGFSMDFGRKIIARRSYLIIDEDTAYSQVALPSDSYTQGENGGWPENGCGITTLGQLKCWGINKFGEAGDGTTTPNPYPISIDVGTRYLRVALGRGFGCGITNDGKLKVWGMDVGSGSYPTNPHDIDPGTKYAMVSASGYTAFAITRSGQLRTWGSNDVGKLGSGMVPDLRQLQPVTIDIGTTYSQVSGPCGITTSGFAKCWGDNLYGSVGDGTLIEKLVPAAVRSLEKFVQIDSDGRRSCGIKESGERACWGLVFHFQEGNGRDAVFHNTSYSEPKNVDSKRYISTQPLLSFRCRQPGNASKKRATDSADASEAIKASASSFKKLKGTIGKTSLQTLAFILRSAAQAYREADDLAGIASALAASNGKSDFRNALLAFISPAQDFDALRKALLDFIVSVQDFDALWSSSQNQFSPYLPIAAIAQQFLKTSSDEDLAELEKSIMAFRFDADVIAVDSARKVICAENGQSMELANPFDSFSDLGGARTVVESYGDLLDIFVERPADWENARQIAESVGRPLLAEAASDFTAADLAVYSERLKLVGKQGVEGPQRLATELAPVLNAMASELNKKTIPRESIIRMIRRSLLASKRQELLEHRVAFSRIAQAIGASIDPETNRIPAK